MNWFSLTTEVLAKKRLECLEEQESTSTDSSNDVIENLGKEGKLAPLEAAAISCVLEMACLQLFIIDVGTCETSPDCSNIIARQKILEVMRETQEEIKSKGTFEVLYENAKEEAKTRAAYKHATKSMIRNQFQIQDLQSKLRGHEYSKQKEMNKKQEIIASLKDQIHEEITKNDLKLRYTDRWEEARQGQNRIRCQNAELELEKKLEEINSKYDNEIRVHHEMCTFLVQEEQKLLEKVKNWKETYENEMKRRTEKIKQLETRKKEQQILLHDLTQLYEEHQKEINDYLDFKEKIRKEQERERYINEMATKIQAWWRGTMVRRGLGPFKKKKKPVKEKKKK